MSAETHAPVLDKPWTGKLLGLNYDEVCDLIQQHLYGFNPVTDQTLSTDNVHGVEEAVDELWTRLPADPPADLPATLASVDDVRRVCVAAGLPGKNEETTTPQWVVPDVLTVAWIRHPGVVYLYRHPSGEHYASLFPGATGVELFAAIQAARSAS